MGNLPNDQLIVWVHGSSGHSAGGGGAVAVTAKNGSTGPSQQQIDAARSAAASIARSLGAGRPLELDALHNPGAATSRLGPGGGDAALVNPITEHGAHGFEFVDSPTSRPARS